MKLNKVIAIVEELESRLMKDISQKAESKQSLKNLLAKRGLITKSDLDKLEEKYETQLKQMREEIDEIRARMITRESLRKWEFKIKKRMLIYTLVQLAMCVVFFVVL